MIQHNNSEQKIHLNKVVLEHGSDSTVESLMKRTFQNRRHDITTKQDIALKISSTANAMWCKFIVFGCTRALLSRYSYYYYYVLQKTLRSMLSEHLKYKQQGSGHHNKEESGKSRKIRSVQPKRPSLPSMGTKFGMGEDEVSHNNNVRLIVDLIRLFSSNKMAFEKESIHSLFTNFEKEINRMFGHRIAVCERVMVEVISGFDSTQQF